MKAGDRVGVAVGLAAWASPSARARLAPLRGWILDVVGDSAPRNFLGRGVATAVAVRTPRGEIFHVPVSLLRMVMTAEERVAESLM